MSGLKLAVLWAIISAVAIGTWAIDPDGQHVLMFASGGLWSMALIAVFTRSRKDTGRRTPLWLLALLGTPVVVVLTLSIALTWEVLSPLAVPASAPFRLLEAWVAIALGRIGAGSVAARARC
jgi:hypothetical protein